MKREDVRKWFPEATEEQIDGILNQVGSELNPLKASLAEVTGKAGAAEGELNSLKAVEADLRSQLEAAVAKVQATMTDEERMRAREEAAEAAERDFKRKSNALDARSVFLEAGIPAEGLDALVAQVVTDDLESTMAGANAIARMMSAVREAAAQATREELLKGNPAPKGAPGVGTGGAPMTLKDFLALPDAEQIALKQSEPGIIARLRTQQ